MRGRRELDSVEVIRRRVWYLNVTARSGLPLYAMDVKFDLDIDSRSSRKGMGRRRRKLFEDLRDRNLMPFRGRLDQFLEKVDSTTGLEGSKALYLSPFWKLMGRGGNLQLKEIREAVVECIRLLDLECRPGDFMDDGSSSDPEAYADEFPDMAIREFVRLQKLGDEGYDQAMAWAFLHIEPSLDYIALLFVLALEAICAGNMKVATDLVHVFSVVLRWYCDASWLEPMADQLYQLGMDRMRGYLMADALKGLPGYMEMFADAPGFNSGAPAMAFLKRHQRLLWRR